MEKQAPLWPVGPEVKTEWATFQITEREQPFRRAARMLLVDMEAAGRERATRNRPLSAAIVGFLEV
ncbi:hypothetical protein RU08_19805 [Pseudomonas fulva]|uniref:Uncharacterized protein n=1 Tax=Pseudomonas fulva TaxID=47880 RepID=A0A0D0ITS5_9PSED|nr:hypothetical protein RU08_19805 [Pseudomonas fulva]